MRQMTSISICIKCHAQKVRQMPCKKRTASKATLRQISVCQRALCQKPPHKSKQQSSCVKVPWNKGHLRQKTFTLKNLILRNSIGVADATRKPEDPVWSSSFRPRWQPPAALERGWPHSLNPSIPLNSKWPYLYLVEPRDGKFQTLI